MRNWTSVALAACGVLAVAGCGGGDGRSHEISGAVSGAVAGGVLVTIVTQVPTQSYATVTGADGRYALGRLPDGAYEVVPSAAGFRFEPTSRPVTIAGGDVSGNDFTAIALPGTIDATFGTGGTVATAFGSAGGSPSAAALQPDGKIVLAGSAASATGHAFALARYDGDGALDPAFGTGGEVTTAVGTDAVASAVAIQPDGKIVVAGSSSSSVFTLVRYDAAGRLDPGFGSGGVVTSTVAASGSASAVALAPGGKIVVAGTVQRSGGDAFLVARYGADGALDAGFGTGGVATTSIGGNARASAVAVQADGKILAAGDAFTGATPSGEVFALARWAADGSLDPAFGTGGVVTTATANADGDLAAALAIDAEGKILAAGKSLHSFGTTFALVRYLADGSPDPAFGDGGAVSTGFTFLGDAARALALQPDGKILAAGTTRVVSAQRLDYEALALARYRPDGSLDATFGDAGQVTTRIGFASDQHDVPSAVGLQPDGKIVVAGCSWNSARTGANGFALARLWP